MLSEGRRAGENDGLSVALLVALLGHGIELLPSAHLMAKQLCMYA